MPIYEFECDNCGERFDKMQRISDEPPVLCANCGKGPIRRVYHPVGVIFKGSGWYINDSRKAEKSGNASSDTSDTSSKDGGDKAVAGETSSTGGTNAAPATTSSEE